MRNPTIYKRKIEEVEAFQIQDDGKGYKNLPKWLKKRVVFNAIDYGDDKGDIWLYEEWERLGYDKELVAGVYANGYGKEILIREGDYIINKNFGEIAVMNKKKFERKFKAVEE